MPDIDDAFASKVSRFATAQELRDDIRNFMKEEAKRKGDDLAKEKAVGELVKMMDAEVPDELVEQELAGMINDLKQQIAQAQMTFEDYLKKARYR